MISETIDEAVLVEAIGAAEPQYIVVGFSGQDSFGGCSEVAGMCPP